MKEIPTMWFPIVLAGGVIALVFWPAISKAFSGGGAMPVPGAAPKMLYPNPGDLVTVYNSRPGAMDPAIGWSAAAQNEIQRRFASFGYAALPSGAINGMPSNGPADAPGIKGYVSAWIVLPQGNGSGVTVSLPSDLGTSSGNLPSDLRTPGLDVLEVKSSPAAQAGMV